MLRILILFSLVGCAFVFGRLSTVNAMNDNDALHRWACDTVIAYDIAKGGDTSAGCYDICAGHAIKVNANLSLGDQLKYPHWESSEYPLFVESEDGYPSSFVNACAITLHGDEW